MRKWFIVMAIGVTVSFGAMLLIQHNKQSCADDVKPAFQFWDKLSEYNFFDGELRMLKPSVRLVSYDLATPLFSDYTVKDRFIFLPEGKSMAYQSDGLPVFPDSTIIIKNFAYRDSSGHKIMIETRLLVKDPADSKWKVMVYLWNKEQTDAIKHITGEKLQLQLLDNEGRLHKTAYQVPNTNDCKTCHVSNNYLTPIGPKIRNLNFTRPGDIANQLTRWAEEGRLTGLPAIDKIAALPVWTNAKFTIEQRARAYLDVNCAHCHSRGGDASNTGLFLEYEEKDPQHLGIMKTPVSAGAGAGGLNYDVVPGNAKQSVLLYRMNSTEAGTAMPELARSLIHKEAVELITKWIQEMTPGG